jgi:DNA repair protein RadA/Sms
MARPSPKFVCQSCGASYPKWGGRCEGCGSWNSLSEEQDAAAIPGSKVSGRGGRIIELVSVAGSSEPPPRLLTGLAEFDRVCGGGLVPGSALLIGGDPGIGKSTLLMQALTAIAKSGKTAVYISGEEGIDQTRLRAKRLGLEHSQVRLAAETSLRDILSTLESGQPPAVLVVDSIQTLWADSIEAAPGTVSQVRACSQELIRFAKRRGTALLLIGHVTKDGQIAGPRVVEHMVDAVLYFEGERGHQFRILRAVKNRFGPTDEIGVFEMMETGLAEVLNPSAPARRNPGPRRAGRLRRTAPRRRGLGLRAPGHGARCSRRARRHRYLLAGRLPQRGGRPSHRRAWRRPRRRWCPCLVPPRRRDPA